MPAQGNSDRHAVEGDRGANDEIGNVHEDDHHNHKDSEDSEDDSDADPEDDYENEPDNDGFDNDKQPGELYYPYCVLLTHSSRNY